MKTLRKRDRRKYRRGESALAFVELSGAIQSEGHAIQPSGRRSDLRKCTNRADADVTGPKLSISHDVGIWRERVQHDRVAAKRTGVASSRREGAIAAPIGGACPGRSVPSTRIAFSLAD